MLYNNKNYTFDILKAKQLLGIPPKAPKLSEISKISIYFVKLCFQNWLKFRENDRNLRNLSKIREM